MKLQQEKVSRYAFHWQDTPRPAKNGDPRFKGYIYDMDGHLSNEHGWRMKVATLPEVLAGADPSITAGGWATRTRPVIIWECKHRHQTWYAAWECAALEFDNQVNDPERLMTGKDKAEQVIATIVKTLQDASYVLEEDDCF